MQFIQDSIKFDIIVGSQFEQIGHQVVMLSLDLIFLYLFHDFFLTNPFVMQI